ncbi:MAG: hypothetical protein J5988_12785 [Eubacterium sp.]|nr:hypothetical protein [Eubacterium sp.]
MIDEMGENASEMINKLSRQLEHARNVADMLLMNMSDDFESIDIKDKKLLNEYISVYKADKENN